MRVFRLTASLLLAASLPYFAGCGGSNTVLTPQPPLARGNLDSLSSAVTIMRSTMAADQNSAIITPIGGAPQCDVSLYTLKYATTGVNGERANASAGLFLPTAACGAGPYPLVSYEHGTNIVRAQLISDPSTVDETLTAPDQLPVVVAAIFASHGYAVVATDYLGLGLSTYPYHPYLHADSEASAAIDALRAARQATQRLGVALSGGVFITGHSQGAQAAVATQRAIERDNASEFHVLGDAPSSGPYALSQSFLDGVVHPTQDASIFSTYTFTGYQKIYGNVYNTPADVFQLPYANGIESLLPVPTLQDQAALEGQKLPLDVRALLQPAFVSDFVNNPNNSLRQDLVKNDLLNGWKPVAPVFLCGGSRDPEVEFKNATAAQTYFSSVGPPVPLTDVNPLIPPSVPLINYHVTVADFCLTIARAKFFDALKATATARRSTVR